MAKAPSFQWYPKDCDTDENVRRMDDREFGFYMRCLNHSWLNDGLPGDLAELARVMNRPAAYVKRLWGRVGRCFDLSDGRYRNPKQEVQRMTVREYQDSRRKGAEARWSKRVHMQCTTNAPTTTDAPEMECSPSPTASPTPPPIKRKPENLFDPMPGWLRFASEYPPHRINKFTDVGVWIGVVEDIQTETVIFEKLPKFKKSAQWTKENGEYVPSASRFIGQRVFETEPGPPPQTAAGASNPYSDSDILTPEKIAERKRKRQEEE